MSMPTADDLKAQLADASSATIYVDAGETEPTEDELTALLADGIHAEWDAVRGKLAVRVATEDEIPAPEAAPEPEPEPEPTY